MNANAIVSAAGLLGAKLPTRDALEAISQILRGIFEINRLSFAIYDNAQDDFRISYVEVDEPSRYGAGFRLPRRGTRIGAAFTSKRPRLSDNLQCDQFLEDRYLAAEGMRTGVSIPLVNDAGTLGTLNADWRKPSAVDSGAIGIIHAVANAFTHGASMLALSNELCPDLRHSETRKNAPPTQTLAEMETAYITSVLESRSWRVSGKAGAAAALAVHPNTLRSRMQKLGIKRPSQRAV